MPRTKNRYHVPSLQHPFCAVLKTTFVLCALLAGTLVSVRAQTPPAPIEIEPGGKLWITGSAGIADYSCEAEELSGNGIIENSDNPQGNIQGQGAVSIVVNIPVHTLECGKKKMNKDMYNALKAEQHPFIKYQLLQANLEDSTHAAVADDGWMDIKTTGTLTIAGVEDTAVVFVQGKLLNPSTFRVKGEKLIHMKTFDIKPPTALFGLIKAGNELTVHFDVTEKMKNQDTFSSLLLPQKGGDHSHDK